MPCPRRGITGKGLPTSSNSSPNSQPHESRYFSSVRHEWTDKSPDTWLTAFRPTLLRLLSLVNINESRLQPLCRHACNPSRGSVHSRPTFHFVIALRDELPSRNVIPTIITITFNIITNHRALAAVLRNVRFEGHAIS